MLDCLVYMQIHTVPYMWDTADQREKASDNEIKACVNEWGDSARESEREEEEEEAAVRRNA